MLMYVPDLHRSTTCVSVDMFTSKMQILTWNIAKKNTFAHKAPFQREQNRHVRETCAKYRHVSEPSVQSHDLLRQSHVTFLMRVVRNLFCKRLSIAVYAHVFLLTTKMICLNLAHMFFLFAFWILFASVSVFWGFFFCNVLKFT